MRASDKPAIGVTASPHTHMSTHICARTHARKHTWRPRPKPPLNKRSAAGSHAHRHAKRKREPAKNRCMRVFDVPPFPGLRCARHCHGQTSPRSDTQKRLAPCIASRANCLYVVDCGARAAFKPGTARITHRSRYDRRQTAPLD